MKQNVDLSQCKVISSCFQINKNTAEPQTVL